MERFNDFGFDNIFKAALAERTIKDIADRYRVVEVKCPHCTKTLKVRIKV